jgi:hypothetical protein
MPAVAKVFETVSTATVSKSAAQAIEHGFLRPTDKVTMNRERLLADAKARALAMVEGYAPPEPPTFRLPGEGEGPRWPWRSRGSARGALQRRTTWSSRARSRAS